MSAATQLERLTRRLQFKADKMARLREVVSQVTGVSDLRIKNRKPINSYARMIFTHHCLMGDMTLHEVGKELGRDHSTASYLNKKYKENRDYNKDFQKILERVDFELKKLFNTDI